MATRLAFALLFVFVAVSAACSDPRSDTSASAHARATTPDAAATPTLIPGTVATPKPTPHVVQVEFPDWVEDSPQMALRIATSDLIAQATFISLESTTKEFRDLGYEAELIYKFEIVQYLKGDGANDVDIRIGSGPKRRMFPDVLEQRTESEARKFAESWLQLSRSAVGDKRDAILFLRRSPQTDAYIFMSFKDDLRHYPAFGETWLDVGRDSIYRHLFTDGRPAMISLADLKTRIEDLRPLMEGEYGPCVSNALHWRDRVRSQLLGTYREFSLAGYQEPDPFPRYGVTLGLQDSRYYPGFDNSRPVFEFRRPPYKQPLFSDYWLDGKDKDLFEIRIRIEPEITYEAMAIANDLRQGAYSVHYSQYYQSLPCDEESQRSEGAWQRRDTAEWVVNIY